MKITSEGRAAEEQAEKDRATLAAKKSNLEEFESTLKYRFTDLKHERQLELDRQTETHARIID